MPSTVLNIFSGSSHLTVTKISTIIIQNLQIEKMGQLRFQKVK